MYTALKDELLRMRQLKTACILTIILSATGIISSRLHETLKLLKLSPAVYILMQNAAILNTCQSGCVAEQRIEVLDQ